MGDFRARSRGPVASLIIAALAGSIVVGTLSVAIAADEQTTVSNATTDTTAAPMPSTDPTTTAPTTTPTTAAPDVTTTTAPPADTTTTTSATVPANTDATPPPPEVTTTTTTSSATSCARTGHETVATDKDDYSPEQTVQISGNGYAPSCDVVVRVTRPNGSVVKGDGTFTPGSDTATTNLSGGLHYAYILDGVLGTYRVDVIGANNQVLATTTFTDAPLTYSISWEKLQEGTGYVRLGGATFTIGPVSPTTTGPFACTGDSTNPVTVADNNGTTDSDGTAGQFTVTGVCPGNYKVTETIAPTGFMPDPDPDRLVTVTNANEVIGTQGTPAQECGPDPVPAVDSDEADFCDPAVTGQIRWEKRSDDGGTTAPRIAGATFVVSGVNVSGPWWCSGTTGPVTVVDQGANDGDTTAGGRLALSGVCDGTYDVTETVPPTDRARESDPTRRVTVAAGVTVTIGSPTAGTNTRDDCPDPAPATDGDLTSDFCNGHLFNLDWEKLEEGTGYNRVTVSGATFTISGPSGTTGPWSCWSSTTGTVTVVDQGTNDGENTLGQLRLKSVCPGTYTVTETVPPAGYTLDSDPDRAVTVSNGDATIGTQGTAQECGPDPVPGTDLNSADFCDFKVPGAIAWEKRTEAGVLLAGATFTVTPRSPTTTGPFACSGDTTNPVTVVDNGTNDGLGQNGKFLLSNVCPGNYTVTETVPPAEFAKDPDATRDVTVASATVTIGSTITTSNNIADDCPDGAPATDGDLTSDFCDQQLYRITWEKRQEPNGQSLAGATFTVSGVSPTVGPFACNGDSANSVTVVDQGTNDGDVSTGQLELRGVCPGTYDVTETIPPNGFGLDPDATRRVTITNGNMVIGKMGTPPDDCGPDPVPATDADPTTSGTGSDFCDPPVYRISWEKREETGSGNGGLLGGATFTVSGSPFACRGDNTSTVTVVDDDPNDADKANGQFQLNNVCNGSYTVTETVPPSGHTLDSDPTRAVTVNGANVVIGTQGSAQDCHDQAPATDDDLTSDFCDPTIGARTIKWEKRSHANGNLVGGATFQVSGATGPFACTDDTTNPVTVVDNDPLDTDKSDGQFTLAGVCTGAFTVTETVAPNGMQIDPDPNRAVDTTNANVTIGTQGSAQDCPDNAPATDADPDGTAGSGSDFCDPNFPTLQWEKRSNADGDLVGGATFTVLGASGGPLACRATTANPLTVVDDGTNDSDATHGQFKLVDVCPGSYTITETVPPTGYIKDPDNTRAVTVGTTDVVIGTQGTADDCPDADASVDGNLTSDFCNPKLFKISWEKRYEPTGDFLTGATFEVSGANGGPGPFACAGDPANPVVVKDQGPNDADGNGGNIALANVCPGTYVITETVPATHYALDPDPTRTVTVTNADEVIGKMGLQEDCGPDPNPSVDTDEADFCDPETWDILWEKREDDNAGAGPYVEGATFEVSGTTPPQACRGNNTNPITVVDQGTNDAESSKGQLRLNNVCPGTYTVTETIPPPGLALDPDNTRTVTIAVNGPNVSIGTQGKSDDCTDPAPAEDADGDTGSDFCDPRVANRTIEWEKRREPSGSLLGGATFSIGSLSPTTAGPFACIGNFDDPVTVADDGPLDKDSTNGKIKVINVCPGTYTITETGIPSGFAFEQDKTRDVDVTAGDAVVGTQGTEDDCHDPDPAVDTDEADFCNPATFRISWEKRRQSDGDLLGGATFTISAKNPPTTTGPFACRGDNTNPVTVKDNGPLDIDANDGQIRVQNICAGTYTVTETSPPPGYALDPDNTRDKTVTGSISGDENPIGNMHHADGSCPDNSAEDIESDDFCNTLATVFDLSWEKRNDTDNGVLLGGAEFSVEGDSDGPFGCTGVHTNPVTVIDNGTNDADLVAGQIRLENVCPGTYTVKETSPPTGFDPENDDTRSVTITNADVSIGIKNTPDDCPDETETDLDSYDFCNALTVHDSTVTTEVHNADHVDVTNSSVPAGSVVHDQATVTGDGDTPTGTVDFDFFTTGDCTGDKTTESGVSLDANGVAESSATDPLLPGSYSYLAHYSGDTTHRGDDGDCEPFTVDKYSSTVTTEVHNADHEDVTNSSVPAGSVVHDQATVSGDGPTPTGTIDFDFWTNGECDGRSTTESGITLDANGVAESSASDPLLPGSYSYLAHYSGDDNYAADDGDCEPFTVDKYESTVTTEVHNADHVDVTNSSVPAGSVVHDQASVSGDGPTPTGTIDFDFFTTGDCTGDKTTESGVSLDANGVAESSATDPLLPGSYSYLAHYGGDDNYAADDGDCEPFTVDKYSSTVTTEVHNVDHEDVTNSNVPAGSVIHDQASVSGDGPTPTGTIDFDFFTTGDCTGEKTTESGVSLDGNAQAESSATDPLLPGSYSYLAHYGGDDNYAADDGDCEPFTVDKYSSTVTTEVHNVDHEDVTNGNVPAGSVIHDQASVSGDGPTPTGTIDFDFFTDGRCDGTPTTESGVALDGNGEAESLASDPLLPGSYSYLAHYGGDDNYAADDGDCEPFTVDKYDSTTTTEVHNAAHEDVTGDNLDANAVVHDQATVSGDGPTPTGTIDFDFFTDGSCDGTPTTESGVSLDGNGQAESTDSSALTPGNYSYLAHYSGDDNYESSDGDCEPFSVDLLQSTTVTEVHDADHNDVTNGNVPAGSVVHDQATVTGDGDTPTGTVDFDFFTTGDCTGDKTTESGVSLDANGVAESSDTDPLPPGSYSYLAHYGGDGNYTVSDGECEPFTVDKYDSTTTTEVHNAAHDDVTKNSVPANSVVHDQATVSGSGPTPSGTVDFDFFTNGICDGTPTPETGVALDGNGEAESSDSDPLLPGSYSYLAHYSGDDNYETSDGDCEPFSVDKFSSSTTTEVRDAGDTDVTGSTVLSGSVIHDHATVAGDGPTPTGTVDFDFFLNGICDGTPDNTEADVALGSGAADSTDSSALGVGSYAYLAHYSGDDNYEPSDGECEPVDVAEVSGETGTIRVEKVTEPDPTATGPFPIDIVGPDPDLPTTIPLAGGGSGQSVIVDAGSGFGVSEQVPDDWTLKSTTCTSSDNTHTAIDPTAFSVDVGELVTCVFVNDPVVEVHGVTTTRTGTLPFTGSDGGMLARLGAVLALLGFGFVLAGRRRRRALL